MRCRQCPIHTAGRCLIDISTHEHDAKIQRLVDLLHERSAVEANILASTKRVEHAYLLASDAFQIALAQSLQDPAGHDINASTT